MKIHLCNVALQVFVVQGGGFTLIQQLMRIPLVKKINNLYLSGLQEIQDAPAALNEFKTLNLH